MCVDVNKEQIDKDIYSNSKKTIKIKVKLFCFE